MSLHKWGRILGAGMLVVLLSGCAKGFQKFSGYAWDMTTGAVVLDFTMEVDSPDVKQNITPDSSGRFEFKLKTDSDYIIKITKGGFRTFVSSNTASTAGVTTVAGTESLYRIFMAMLVPTTVSHAGLTAKVYDAAAGTAITGGFFRLVPTGVTSAAFQNEVFKNGSSASPAVVTPKFWMPDGGIVAGPIASGAFSIPAASMLPGYTYNLSTIGVPGYRDQNTSVAAFGTHTMNTVSEINLALTKTAQDSAAPILVAQSQLGPSGAAVPIGTDRKVVLTFDRPVTIDTKSLKGLGSNNFITIVAPHDAADTTAATSTVPKVETVAATAVSTNITVAVSGNKITITLAGADTDLITTTVNAINTTDDLYYTLTSAGATGFLNNIFVRDAAQSTTSWTSLSGLGALSTVATNKIIIRENSAP